MKCWPCRQTGSGQCLQGRIFDEAFQQLGDVEYADGHIPGALSFPLEELERRLDELPADLPIVAYCRGPYCVIADQALELLVSRGFQTFRLEEGVVEWHRNDSALSR